VIVAGDTKFVYFARVIEDALASEVTINKTKQLTICHAFCAVAGIVSSTSGLGAHPVTGRVLQL
jgi:hypothetical protein